MQDRIQAAALADSILQSLEKPVAREDISSVRSVIVECALFEEPMPDLKVAVHSVGSYYNVTVSGYRNIVDLVKWVNTFLGNNRALSMANVIHTYLQMSDTSFFIVLQIQKVEMHVSSARYSTAQEPRANDIAYQMEAIRGAARPARSGQRNTLVKRVE